MFVTVKARIYADATGAYTELPALLTPAGILEPLHHRLPIERKAEA